MLAAELDKDCSLILDSGCGLLNYYYGWHDQCRISAVYDVWMSGPGPNRGMYALSK